MPNTITWEQRKLGEVVERITRKNLNLESRLPLTISAQDGLISQTEFFDKQVASKNISGYYLIENGEFAYNKSYSNGYPWGAIKRLDKYKNGVLSTLYIVFKPIDVDSQFLVSYFDTTFWHSEIAEIAVEGARNHGLLNIPVMDFFRIKIKIPKSKEEQTQIGNFFKQLDDTIALHQRELEKFKILKTSYLENIFLDKVSLFTAKNTITWEQRKLGEVVERITRKNLNLESRLPLTISAQDGLISQTEFFDKQVASKNISGYYLIENGEFAYNKSYSNGYPWGAIKRLDKYKNGVLSTLYIVFKPIDVDSQFLVSYFDTTFWHSEIAEIAVEGARNHGLLNIPVMDFFRIKIKIPKSKEEQTQIGNFFKQLDDTIALHQKELAKYQQIKTACLEKMFVE